MIVIASLIISGSLSVTQDGRVQPIDLEEVRSEFRSVLQEGIQSNRINTLNGDYYFLNRFSAEYGKYDKQFKLFRLFDEEVPDLVLLADITWEASGTYPSLIDTGCGFVFRNNDDARVDEPDSFMHAQLVMEGKDFFWGLNKGKFVSYGRKYYKDPSFERQTNKVVIFANGSDTSVFINGKEVPRNLDVAVTTPGLIHYTVQSGTEKDYGTRCTFENINLFVPRTRETANTLELDSQLTGIPAIITLDAEQPKRTPVSTNIFDETPISTKTPESTSEPMDMSKDKPESPGGGQPEPEEEPEDEIPMPPPPLPPGMTPSAEIPTKDPNSGDETALPTLTGTPYIELPMATPDIQPTETPAVFFVPTLPPMQYPLYDPDWEAPIRECPSEMVKGLEWGLDPGGFCSIAFPAGEKYEKLCATPEDFLKCCETEGVSYYFHDFCIQWEMDLQQQGIPYQDVSGSQCDDHLNCRGDDMACYLKSLMFNQIYAACSWDESYLKSPCRNYLLNPPQKPTEFEETILTACNECYRFLDINECQDLYDYNIRKDCPDINMRCGNNINYLLCANMDRISKAEGMSQAKVDAIINYCDKYGLTRYESRTMTLPGGSPLPDDGAKQCPKTSPVKPNEQEDDPVVIPTVCPWGVTGGC